MFTLRLLFLLIIIFEVSKWPWMQNYLSIEWIAMANSHATLQPNSFHVPYQITPLKACATTMLTFRERSHVTSLPGWYALLQSQLLRRLREEGCLNSCCRTDRQYRTRVRSPSFLQLCKITSIPALQNDPSTLKKNGYFHTQGSN